MSGYAIDHLLFFFFCTFSFIQLAFSELPTNQRATMNKLYQFLQNNTAPPSSLSWNLTKDPNPCSWEGVVCNSNNSSITQISLPLLSLSTPGIFPILCEIDTLEALNVSNNHLGSIPDGFITGCGNLSGLRRLDLSRNRLFGPLPTFQGFGMLEFLDLSHNFLNGTIDSQLGGLVNLRTLNLSYNHFYGSVPIQLGKSMALEDLQLSANSFGGNIPQDISNYSNLVLIDLSANSLSASIPDSFAGLSKLEVLVLSANNLRGEIPQFISNIRSLFRFAANQNRISGAIPPGITRFVKNLDLSYNKLTGLIPEELLSYSNLQAVDLSHNLLEGPIPADVSPGMVRLRLGNNSLNGTIPSWSFGSLKNLTYLELDTNSLTGPIPPGLGLCQNLALLNLARNRLTGAFPVQLGNLINLQELKLQQNSLVGEIPFQVTQLLGLRKLNISWNSLNGSIPSSISRLQSLTNLDLRGNNLSGLIPDSVGSLNSLLELQLGKNRLSGNIQAMPQSLQIALNLSSNLFEGKIPGTLSRLTNLEVLDLSSNKFSGEIPESMIGMESLTQLLLSNNLLSGLIPKFRQTIFIDTNGNKGIRKPTDLSPPPATRIKKRTVATGVIIAIATAVLALVLGTLIAVLISKRFDRVNDEHMPYEENVSQLQVIQGNLLTSNGIHRSNIDFNKAMEAVADPTNIVLRTRFSTYYKAVMPSGLSYFVKKLNWSDKIFQLGSHERFDEELEVLGSLSNSNVMTPLAYVLTANSAYLFYEFAPKGTLFDVMHRSLTETLDWGSRYSIAIGVAQGLAFLHGCTSGPILLLDLSSKSILLRSMKEPLVGDIELCKVIDPSKSTGSISAVAGSVGFIPPEYAYTMRITMAGNIYSFGVILLELVTGKPAVTEGIELAKWVSSNSMKQDKLDHILDFRASRASPAVRNQMLAVLKIALPCVSISPEARPKAKSILRMLMNAR